MGVVVGAAPHARANPFSLSFHSLGVVVLVLRDLRKQLERFLDQVLADDLEDLVLLQGLARDVEREVLGVDDAADEAEPLGDELVAVVLFFKGEIWEIFLSKKEEKKRKKLPLAAACRSKGERAKNQSQHNAP